MSDTTSDTLKSALERHAIVLPDDQIEKIDEYCRLLWDWNSKINLTRHTDYEKFVARDVVDSQQLANLLVAGESVLDVGTGGGVPGVLLAILRPDVQVSLSEPVGKKARAVQDMIQHLGLTVPVHTVRAEALLEQLSFDTLVARAVGPLLQICRWFAPRWGSFGRLLIIKGPRWVDERNEARHHGVLRKLELRVAARYPMPGTESESVILKLWPKGKGESSDEETE